MKRCDVGSISSETGYQNGIGLVFVYNNGTLELVHGHTNLISCVGNVNDSTFAVYPPDNGVCLPVEEAPKLRN